MVHKVHNVEVNESQIEQYMPRIMDEFAELSKEEVIKRFASLEFNRFLEYYKNAPDLNSSADDRGERGERGERGQSQEAAKVIPACLSTWALLMILQEVIYYLLCATMVRSVEKASAKLTLKVFIHSLKLKMHAVESLFNNFKGIEFNNRGVRIEKTADGDSGGGGGRSRGGFSGGGRREGGSYGGGRREGGERKSYGGGGRREGGNSGGGFRDFSGRSREDRGGSGAGRREGGNSGGGDRKRRS